MCRREEGLGVTWARSLSGAGGVRGMGRASMAVIRWVGSEVEIVLCRR